MKNKQNIITQRRNAFRKQIVRTYNGIKITSRKFDCGYDSCEECIICNYLNEQDRAYSCAIPFIRDKFLENYLKFVF